MVATIDFDKLTTRFRCDGLDGGVLVDDIGGNNATPSGSPAFETSSPMLGTQHVLPDGTDDKFEAANDVAFQMGTDDFTVTILLDLDAAFSKFVFGCIRTTGQPQGYELELFANGTMTFRMFTTNGSVNVSSATDFRGNGPTAIMISIDRSDKMHLYADGVLDTSSNSIAGHIGHTVNPDLSFWLSANTAGINLGNIAFDEFAMYKGYLGTADDAAFMYNGGAFRALEGAPAFKPRTMVIF